MAAKDSRHSRQWEEKASALVVAYQVIPVRVNIKNEPHALR